MIAIIVSGGISFLIVLVTTNLGVNFFKSKKIGQSIQEEVNFHEHKKGTPTMGGVFVIFGTIVGYLFSHVNFWTIGSGFKVVIRELNLNVFAILLLAVLMSSVGLLDDLLKVRKKQNLGLTSKSKIILQLLVSLISVAYFINISLNTNLNLFSGYEINISYFKWLLIIFLIVGITNSVNFTDGLDGLVAGTSSISFGSLLIITFWMFRNKSYYSNFVLDDYLSLDISILISSVAGACLGFLWWNTNPAKIILGDVGSHFIGSIIVLLLISISAEGLILLICMIFIIEALSVVLQIVSYKLRKKRIFKMAPVHHHFEMSGWAETTVIVRFWILNGIFVILALGLFYADWVLYGN